MFRNILCPLICTLLVASIPSFVQAEDLNWAQKMFEKQNHDFGVVARGADAIYRLKLTNKYVQSVHISNVRTSCGCTAATPSQNTLATNEVAYIQISMDTRRFTREKNSNVIVTFDAPLYQEVTIPIHAYIRTDVVLTPGAAEFGAVPQGAEQERKISVTYAGRPDWSIKNIVVPNEELAARFVETSRENGRVAYDLFVKVKSTAAIGEFRERITLVTDDQNSPEIPVLVEGRVEPEVTVTVSGDLGQLTPGQTKTVNVVLRGRKPFMVEKIESDSGSEAFQVRLPEKASVIHVIPLIVTAPAEGSLDEVFTVTIPDLPAVQFKVTGKVGS